MPDAPMTLWPATYDSRELQQLVQGSAPAAVDWLSSRRHVGHLAEALEGFYMPLALKLHHWRRAQSKPLLLGIAGAQGSGKSTLGQLLAVILERGFGYRVATLSIDDLYLPRLRREELARTVHPLLVTRGVPGTHDPQLGLATLGRLRRLGADESMHLPRFDKARDDRLPSTQWPPIAGPVDVILFEGWCVGARPQPEYALKIAVNPLEECEDADLTWRGFVNQHLNGDYARLFAELDRLLFLKAPGWPCVFTWRRQQEQELARATPEGEGPHLMNDEQLQRFIQHYERLTRLMLATVPGYADVVVELGADHEVTTVHLNA